MAQVRHTKSFKKYSEEFRPEVVNAARSWANERPEKLAFYEDNSIVKITGSKDDIDEMVASLRGRFGSPLPGETVAKDEKKS